MLDKFLSAALLFSNGRRLPVPPPWSGHGVIPFEVQLEPDQLIRIYLGNNLGYKRLEQERVRFGI